MPMKEIGIKFTGLFEKVFNQGERSLFLKMALKRANIFSHTKAFRLTSSIYVLTFYALKSVRQKASG